MWGIRQPEPLALSFSLLLVVLSFQTSFLSSLSVSSEGRKPNYSPLCCFGVPSLSTERVSVCDGCGIFEARFLLLESYLVRVYRVSCCSNRMRRHVWSLTTSPLAFAHNSHT